MITIKKIGHWNFSNFINIEICFVCLDFHCTTDRIEYESNKMQKVPSTKILLTKKSSKQSVGVLLVRYWYFFLTSDDVLPLYKWSDLWITQNAKIPSFYHNSKMSFFNLNSYLIFLSKKHQNLSFFLTSLSFLGRYFDRIVENRTLTFFSEICTKSVKIYTNTPIFAFFTPCCWKNVLLMKFRFCIFLRIEMY